MHNIAARDGNIVFLFQPEIFYHAGMATMFGRQTACPMKRASGAGARHVWPSEAGGPGVFRFGPWCERSLFICARVILYDN
jgi:hypothetical protein